MTDATASPLLVGNATGTNVDDGTSLVVQVNDDGVGGAVASAGSGLAGLADRLEALCGTIEVASPPAGGTRIAARIPL